MPGWTNRGTYRTLGYKFRAQSPPGSFYLALCTSTVAPGADTNVLGDMEEVAAGNGYVAGGVALSPGATDFPVWTEDDVNDRSIVGLRDVDFTASEGTLPASGGGARYAVLTDDAGTVADREVHNIFDLLTNYTVSDGQYLRLQGSEVRLTP